MDPSKAGQQLAQYRILEPIAAGGMGQVYRALDTALDREVALKFLPDEVVGDDERVRRFRREAKLLAALNHPNIGAIHGFEEVGGTPFLVLELVEGEDLAERLEHGPLPIREALTVALQIAEALEAAHDQGIIHRDLKPGNVKLAPDGQVKVLDFGLAKVLRREDADPVLSQSPTMPLATRPGMIMGTFAYMSPEQARGQELDRRCDIWSFGCVVFECLTGGQAFPGATVSDSLAGVLKTEPEWDLLPPATPWTVQRLLHRCLEKDPHLRLHDIADARIEIAEALEHPEAAPAATPGGAAARAAWKTVLPWSLSAVLALVAGLALWQASREVPRPAQPPTRLSLSFLPREPLQLFGSPNAVLSHDGRRIAYVSTSGTTTRLYLRNLDQFGDVRLPGTEGATDPFFSPDGQWVGFFADQKLKKVSVLGGTPEVLCDAPSSGGGSWGPDDTIVFAPLLNGGLWRVASSGGVPEPISALDRERGEVSHRWPHVLPDGDAVLFTVKTAHLLSFDDAPIAAARMGGGEHHWLRQNGMFGRYAPDGYLVYARERELLAARFDTSRLALTGSPVTVLSGVLTNPSTGAAHYAFSHDGSLLYDPSDLRTDQLVWVDREGGWVEPITDERRDYWMPQLSPDGKRVVFWIPQANDALWIYDLARGNLERLTSGPGNDFQPIWTPDGHRLAFSSDRSGTANLYWMPAEAGGEAERLAPSELRQVPTCWSPDGTRLAFDQRAPETGWDIWVLAMEGERRAEPFRQTTFRERRAVFSPDGGWLAYESNESGRNEIYVQPYPGPGRKHQISGDGGSWPVWGREGRELIYRNENQVLSVGVDTGPPFRAGVPAILFEGTFGLGYDLSTDGRRLLMIRPEQPSSEPARLNLVLNWFEELRSRTATTRD